MNRTERINLYAGKYKEAKRKVEGIDLENLKNEALNYLENMEKEYKVGIKPIKDESKVDNLIGILMVKTSSLDQEKFKTNIAVAQVLVDNYLSTFRELVKMSSEKLTLEIEKRGLSSLAGFKEGIEIKGKKDKKNKSKEATEVGDDLKGKKYERSSLVTLSILSNCHLGIPLNVVHRIANKVPLPYIPKDEVRFETIYNTKYKQKLIVMVHEEGMTIEESNILYDLLPAPKHRGEVKSRNKLNSSIVVSPEVIEDSLKTGEFKRLKDA